MSNGYGTGEIHRGRGGRGAFRIVHAGREPARTAPKDAPSAEGSKQAWASGDAQGSTMALEASRGRKLPSTFTASTGRTEGGTRQVIGASRATPSVQSEADTKVCAYHNPRVKRFKLCITEARPRRVACELIATEVKAGVFCCMCRQH